MGVVEAQQVEHVCPGEWLGEFHITACLCRQAVESQRPHTSSRPKSRARAPSAKRPTSAKRGSRKDEAKTKSQFLSFDEAQQVSGLGVRIWGLGFGEGFRN